VWFKHKEVDNHDETGTIQSCSLIRGMHSSQKFPRRSRIQEKPVAGGKQ